MLPATAAAPLTIEPPRKAARQVHRGPRRAGLGAALALALLGAAPLARAAVGLGPDFVVPEAGLFANDQVEPTLAMDANNLFVAWAETGRSSPPSNENLWIRAFLPTGLAKTASVLASSETFGTARTPHLALFSGGKALMAWQDADAGRILVRLFSPDLSVSVPFLTETYISGTGGGASKPRAAVRDTGLLAVVTWAEGSAVMFNRLDANAPTASSARLDGTDGADAAVSGTPGEPDVAGAGGGAFVLAYRTEQSGQKLKAKRFNSDGTPNGSELEVASSPVVSSSSGARIAALGSSRFVVVWNGPGTGSDEVYGQLIALGGSGLTLVGSRFVVNPLSAGVQDQVAVASPSVRDPNTADRFVVNWRDCIGGTSCTSFAADPVGHDGEGVGIAAQLFQVVSGVAQKVGPAFALNSTVEGNQANAALAMDSAGRWAGAWEDPGADGDGQGVLCRRFDQNTKALLEQKLFEGNVNQDGAAPPTIREGASLDSDEAGIVTVVWEDDNGVAGDKDIYLARLSPSGRRLRLDPNDPNSLEVRVNTTTMGNQLRPQVAVEPGSGRGVVAWVHQATPGTDGDVRYRQFSINAGAVVFGTERTVAGSAVLDSTVSSGIAIVDVSVNQASNWITDGRFAIVWQAKEGVTTDTDIHARVFRGDDSAPSPDPGLITVNNLIGTGSQRNPSVGMNASGTFTVVFKRPGSTAGIAARRFTQDGAALADEFRVDTLSIDLVDQPHISTNSAGQSVIVWQALLSGAGSIHAYGRWFDAGGVAQGSNETQLSVNSTFVVEPVCDLSDNAELIVTWQDQDQQELRYRRFSPARQARDPDEVTIYEDSTMVRLYPAVTSTGDGDVFIVYNGVQPTSQGGTSATSENNDLFVAHLTPEPPAAAFSSAVPNCSGSPTSFTDESTTDAFTTVTGWKWDLDYTGTSFDPNAVVQNPSTTYPNAADTIDVLLRVTDNRLTGRTGFALGSVMTQQLPARPAASFTRTLNADRTVDFAGCSSCGGHGAPFRYDWAFGDGGQLNNTTEAAPSHLYAQSGAYTATLNVRDAQGCQSTSPEISSFDVLPIINTVSTDLGGDPVAGVGDGIDLLLTGDPNRVASVVLAQSAGPFTATVGLSETPTGSGVYLGTYTVMAGTGQFSATVTGRLSEPGPVRQATKQAAGTVPIDTVAPAVPVITKDVGLGPGASYTTANPAVTLPGTTASDTQQFVLSGLGGASINYTSGQTTWSVSGILNAGANAITVQARDLAENTSAAESITATLDQVAPVTLHDRQSGGTIRNTDAAPAAEVFFPPGSLRQPTPYTPASVNLTKGATPGGVSLGPGVDKVGLFGWDLQPAENFTSFVRLTLRYSDGDLVGLNEDRLTLAYRDQSLNQWRQDDLFIESFDPDQNTIVFQTLRFGFFTFAEGSQPQPVGVDPSGAGAWVLFLLILALTAVPRLRKERA
jgi:PKD repeat protein